MQCKCKTTVDSRYLPEDGEEGGWVDDEGAVEAAGVVVGDDLERAHEQVEESRRRAEKACTAKRFASPRQSSVNQSPSFSPIPRPALSRSELLSHFCYLLALVRTTRFKPHRREASELPRGGGEERLGLPHPPKAVSATVHATQASYPKCSVGQGPGPRHARKQQRHGNAGPTRHEAAGAQA